MLSWMLYSIVVSLLMGLAARDTFRAVAFKRNLVEVDR
jgi:hypothetical protein